MDVFTILPSKEEFLYPYPPSLSQVHMGTHIWTGCPQVSRRGRRMSLELPPGAPPIPMTAKDKEFLQQRQQQQQRQSPPPPASTLPPPPLPPPPPPPRDLSFFPYLPTPFSVAAAAATTAAAATNSKPPMPRTSVSILMTELNLDG